MKLASISYSEFQGTKNEWTLEPFELGKVNLLVGKNATGKSRTISIIYSLASVLSGEYKRALESGTWDVVFTNGDSPVHYHLEHTNNQVVKENLKQGEQVVLRRTLGAYGHIYNEEVKKKIRFDVPADAVAVFTKRDKLQYPFLEPLIEWGSAVRRFEFGKTMGHQNLGIPVKGPPIPLDEKDTTQVVPIYHMGYKAHTDKFKEAIKADMSHLGYPIEDIDLRRPDNLRIQSPFPLDFVGVSVKERDLQCYTDQPEMSQGMFRALSIVVQLNYLVMSKTATCVLVDDIGEGLDYERSCKLIEILREKSLHSSVQLVMATNDRFVMNRVPLEEWCYLVRKGNRVSVLNYKNAAESFERFKLTGLNNFDLLATHFLEKITENGQISSVR